MVSGWGRRLGWLLVVLALLVGWWGNGRFLVADMARQRSIQAALRGDLTQAITAAQQAVNHWPQEPAHWQQLAQVYGAQSNLAAAADAWQQALALRPNDPTIWMSKAQFYTSAVERGVPGTLAEADGAYTQAAALAPNTARLYAAWGRLHLLVGSVSGPQNETTAVIHLERAVALDITDPLAWRLLAEAYTAQGRDDLAAAARQEAARWQAESMIR